MRPRQSRFIRACVFAVIAPALPHAVAADNSWIGPSTGNWLEPSNWSAGVPQAADNVLIDGAMSQDSIVTLNQLATISALQIDAGDELLVTGTTSGSVLTISGPSTVNRGTISLRPVGASQSGSMLLTHSGDFSLSGDGRIVMRNGRISGPGRLHNLDNTIEGHGSVGGSPDTPGMMNFGLFESNVPAAASTIYSNPIVPMQNRGILRATGQAFLDIRGNFGAIFDNEAGLIEADGGVVRIRDGATIVGGQLRAINSGQFWVPVDRSGVIQDLDTSGEWEVQDRGTLGLRGTITNNGLILTELIPGRTSTLDVGPGTVTLRGTGVIDLGFGAKITGTGKLVIEGGSIRRNGNVGDNRLTIETAGDGVIQSGPFDGTLVVDPGPGGLLNRGTLRAPVASSVLELTGNGGGAFTNEGTIEATGGRVRFTNNAELTNVTGTTLAGGKWLVRAGEIDLDATITENAAHIRFEPGGAFHALDSLDRNSGKLEIASGADRGIGGALENAGEIGIDGGSDLAVAGAFMTTQSSRLTFNLAGVASEQYGQLTSQGATELGGTLAAALVGNFMPSLGNSFVLVAGSSLAGTFDSLDLPALTGGMTFEVRYTSSTATLHVVPEPGSLSIGALGLTALLSVRRARRAN